eukprot:TRINITY_DN3396_c0_g2_i1.p1 TRINITY_DN3396_c0_g2~~TRINITY_DN3396_c0_g2_i1.p1  ORF type:complete len:429 (-),score=54.56 TRINITY_DN3396_c0_g2_i1:96-1382(-)
MTAHVSSVDLNEFERKCDLLIDGNNRLHAACELGLVQLSGALLSANHSLNSPNDSGALPLHIAAKCGQIGVCQALIASNAVYIDATDYAGMTALMYAIVADQHAVASKLLILGASPHAVEAGERSPLILCAALGKAVLVDRLLECKARLTDRFQGLTALEWAERCKHDTVVQKLRAALRVDAPNLVARQVSVLTPQRPCPYLDDCRLVLDSICPRITFCAEGTKCFCDACMRHRNDDPTALRGEPLGTYVLPKGWCRIGLPINPQRLAMHIFDDWHVAFHGTVVEALQSIIQTGFLAHPGDTVLGARLLSVRKFHIKETFTRVSADDAGKLEVFNPNQVFLSPSMAYSGDPGYYAKTHTMTIGDPPRAVAVQVALQVRIRPGAYAVGPETIGAKIRIDPYIPNQRIEWYTEERGGHDLTGVLVKIQPL